VCVLGGPLQRLLERLAHFHETCVRACARAWSVACVCELEGERVLHSGLGQGPGAPPMSPQATSDFWRLTPLSDDGVKFFCASVKSSARTGESECGSRSEPKRRDRTRSERQSRQVASCRVCE
jgi:hypothetical protein